MSSIKSLPPIALVSGGTRGIGLACALALSARGYRVIAAGSSYPSGAFLNKLADERGIEFYEVDLSDLKGVVSLCDHVGSIGQLEVIVHSLGGTLGVGYRDSMDDWNRVHWLNFCAPVEINRLLLPEGVKHGVTRILHISSSAVKHGKASLPYVCSKAALNAYVRSEGRRLLDLGVVLSAIMPAAVSGLDNFWERIKAVDSNRWGRVEKSQALGRFETPEEIADFVVWFVGEGGVLLASQCVLMDANA